MEFPIRFPAPFLNTGSLPYIRSGPSPYISTYPTPYLNYSPSPYITNGKTPYASSDSASNSIYASTDPVTYSSYPDASRSKTPYASSNPASSSNSSYTNSGNASYGITDFAPYSSYRGKAPYASSNPASSSNSSYSYTSSGNASSCNSSYSSDFAMDTSQELSIEEEEYPDGKDLTINDSGISCSDDSESGQIPGKNVRGSRKRKNCEPCRTLLQDDPDFRGVTVTMENKFVNSEWKFFMHSTLSLPPKKKRKFRAYVDSSDEEDMNNNFTPITEEKHCASCSVKKTPLWRDAEDGTPLCNACGIRYKKYKLRCGTCWHIPKKDEFRPTCQYCGSFYEYIYPRR